MGRVGLDPAGYPSLNSFGISSPLFYLICITPDIERVDNCSAAFDRARTQARTELQRPSNCA